MKMNIRQKRLHVILIAFLLTGLCASLTAQAVSTAPVVRPRDSMEFENEAVTLAKGFAKAFQSIPPGGKYIKISTPTGTEFLEGSIDSVKAIDGVLLIRTERGIIHVINAWNVVTITNEKP
jgi:hypothetical protein